MIRTAFIILNLIFLSFSVHAEQNSNVTIVGATIDINFIPKSTYILVTNATGKTKKIDTVLVKLTSDTQSEGTLSRYLIGGELSEYVDGDQYSILIFGENGAYDFVAPKIVAPKIVAPEIQDPRQSSIDELHALVLVKRATLSSRTQQLDDHTLTLKKLRVSAAEVTEIGKIIEIEEETKRVKESSDSLQGDIDTLRTVLQSVKSVPQPYKFEQRKSQLTGQLTEMAQAAVQAEQGVSSRKRSGTADLDKKLSLIDSTRFEDLEELEREYNALTGGVVSEGVGSEIVPDRRDEIGNSPVSADDYFSLSEG